MEKSNGLLECGLPIIAAAIKHEITGEITPGGDHLDARIHAYRIATGCRDDVGYILNEGAEAFDEFSDKNKFTNGFINSILEFFNRATATQMVDSDRTMLHSSVILKSKVKKQGEVILCLVCGVRPAVYKKVKHCRLCHSIKGKKNYISHKHTKRKKKCLEMK